MKNGRTLTMVIPKINSRKSKDACKYVDQEAEKKKNSTALTINDVTYQFPQIKNEIFKWLSSQKS